MIKCWECGKDVSDAASACPSCGAPRKAPAAASIPNEIHVDPAPANEKYTTVSGWKLVIGGIALAVTSFMAVGVFAPDDPDKSKARAVIAQCLAELDKADRSRDAALGRATADMCERFRQDFISKYRVSP